jgi:CrcB protein
MSWRPLPKSGGSGALGIASLGRLLTDLSFVALGAIPGSLLRWLVDNLAVVNLLGAFVLGWLIATAAGRPRAWLLVGGVGFCGSLTSFSGWILALHSRIQSSGWWVALAYWLLELLGGLFFSALGMGLGQWMQRRWPAQLGDSFKHFKH